MVNGRHGPRSPLPCRRLASASIDAIASLAAHWRVNGPLANMPEFSAAFGCKAGDQMVRPDSLRPRIW
jgi:predicted metalloendopeptidase